MPAVLAALLLALDPLSGAAPGAPGETPAPGALQAPVAVESNTPLFLAGSFGATALAALPSYGLFVDALRSPLLPAIAVLALPFALYALADATGLRLPIAGAVLTVALGAGTVAAAALIYGLATVLWGIGLAQGETTSGRPGAGLVNASFVGAILGVPLFSWWLATPAGPAPLPAVRAIADPPVPAVGGGPTSLAVTVLAGSF